MSEPDTADKHSQTKARPQELVPIEGGAEIEEEMVGSPVNWNINPSTSVSLSKIDDTVGGESEVQITANILFVLAFVAYICDTIAVVFSIGHRFSDCDAYLGWSSLILFIFADYSLLLLDWFLERQPIFFYTMKLKIIPLLPFFEINYFRRVIQHIVSGPRHNHNHFQRFQHAFFAVVCSLRVLTVSLPQLIYDIVLLQETKYEESKYYAGMIPHVVFVCFTLLLIIQVLVYRRTGGSVGIHFGGIGHYVVVVVVTTTIIIGAVVISTVAIDKKDCG